MIKSCAVIGYPRDYPPRPARKIFPKSRIINPLLTKLVRSRWLGIGLVFLYCMIMDRDGVEVHKHTKQKPGQYPAILTSHLVNNIHPSIHPSLPPSLPPASQPASQTDRQTDRQTYIHTLLARPQGAFQSQTTLYN